jgi:hypothetical protein
MAVSALTLLFKGKKKIGSMVIDVFTEENHSAKASVTEFPIEDGSNVSDHIFRDGDEVDIKGSICAPMYIFDILKGRGSYFKAQYSQLNDLVGTVVTLVTGLRVYKNVAFTDLSVPRTKDNGGSIEFSAKFKQLPIIKSQTAAIPKSKLAGGKAASKQAQAPTAAGKAASSTVEPTKKLSILDKARADMGVIK